MAKRIISAIILSALLLIVFLLGRWAIVFASYISGGILIREIHLHFWERQKTPKIFISLLSFSSVFILMTYIAKTHQLLLVSEIILGVCLVQQFFLVLYLFAPTNFTQRFLGKLRLSWLATLPLSLIPFVVFRYERWVVWLGLLVVLTFANDIGAWFIGKTLGRTKLFPSVSPNKTIEGFWGGLTSALIVGGVWLWIWDPGQIYLWPSFLFLAAISSLGDLVQSKIKRSCDLKDSSALIPGHGGLYDRLDGLLFLIPFYVLLLHSLIRS